MARRKVVPPKMNEWILSFVQGMDVRTGPEGSWFHQKSLPEFLFFLFLLFLSSDRFRCVFVVFLYVAKMFSESVV